MNKILPIILVVVLAGCANKIKQSNFSGRGYVGNNMISGYDLDDMRKARQTIKYSELLPNGAKIVSKIYTRRCERYRDDVPKDGTLIDDLKIIAYASGGDGFTNFQVENSGMRFFENCFSRKDGSADMYKFD